MSNLIKNELVKIFKKKTIYITMGVIFLLLIFMNSMIKFANRETSLANYYLYNESYINSIKEEIKKLDPDKPSDVTKYINAQTAIYIDEMPTSIFDSGDYIIERISPVQLNTFTVYLNKRQGIKLPKIYFENNGNIIETQFNYDKSTNIGYFPYNKQIPFDTSTKIWNRKVADVNSLSGKIRLVSMERIGKHTKLVFVNAND